MKVAVVGAGIVGRLASRKLARRGFGVTLFDRHDFSTKAACSFAAAGLLAPVAEAVASADPRLHAFGQMSRELWQSLARDLDLPEIPQSTQGTLALAKPADRAELEDFLAKVTRTLPEARIERLSLPELHRLEPALIGESVEGLIVRDEGHVDARAALAILARSLQEDPNVTLRFGVAVKVVDAHRVDDEDFALVVDARGLGAKVDWSGLRGVRGEIVEVRAPEVRLTRPVRMLHQRYPIYVVPRGADRYAIGATSLESESLAPVSVKATMELLSAAYALHSGFRYAEVTELFAQVRPAFDDHWPRIAARPGLVRINGLYRHGFLLSPLIVEAVMRLIVNGIATETAAPLHLAELLDQLGYSRDAVAVALNKDFVPKHRLADTPVQDGDRVEVLAPMAGG